VVEVVVREDHEEELQQLRECGERTRGELRAVVEGVPARPSEGLFIRDYHVEVVGHVGAEDEVQQDDHELRGDDRARQFVRHARDCSFGLFYSLSKPRFIINMSRPVETNAPRLGEDSRHHSKIGEDDSMQPLNESKDGGFGFDLGTLRLSSEHSRPARPLHERPALPQTQVGTRLV